MKIQAITKCGTGVEVIMENNAYFFNLDAINTKEDLVAAIQRELEGRTKQDAIVEQKIVLLKELENSEVMIAKEVTIDIK